MFSLEHDRFSLLIVTVVYSAITGKMLNILKKEIKINYNLV